MAGYFYIGGEKMDLLIEKGGKRTYLSRYKVITTSFEESSPSVKRNNTQIQYRNGNIDFGGWNEAKTIDYVGYYRADDLEDEEYLREKIYALLSDPEGYYITQLKNDNDNSFERPGETSGDYFDKQVNRPSHKRFYVYASSLESELVGSYGGHVLYKISAKFTTMKLPYGESVPRDLDINNGIIPYAGTVTCSQLEQGFIVEFIARQSGGGVTLNLNGTKLTYSGSIVSGDVLKFSGYEYTKNEISIVKATNKAYFKLLPGVANKISSSISGTIRILGYQDLYA